MEIFRVDDGARQIHAGRSWVAADGTRHPKSWARWSAEEKKAAGITTVVLQPLPDDRLYTSSHNADGSVASTPRELDDVGEGIAKVLGVRSALIAEVKNQQASMLAQTDWAIVRKADNGTAIPAPIASWRNAIRSKATDMETAIANAADTDAVAALFLSRDADGKQTGILYDWPELAD